MRWVQGVLGAFFLVFGCLHFALRTREPESRSIYFGGMTFTQTARTVLASTELLLGAVLVLTA